MDDGVDGGQVLLSRPPAWEVLEQRPLPWTSAAASGIIDLGGPGEQTLLWHVRRVSVIHGDPWSAGTVGSLAALCVGIPTLQAGALRVGDLVVPGAEIPSAVLLEAGQVVVLPGQHLYVVVYGGDGTEQASGQVEELVAAREGGG